MEDDASIQLYTSLLPEEDGFTDALTAEIKNEIIGINNSVDELVINEDPLENDLVSKCSWEGWVWM